MSLVRIQRKIDSETLIVPELRDLKGKLVEIVIVEVAPATREEFYAEASHVPQTMAERNAQHEKFRSWRNDLRFERFWGSLDHYLVEMGNGKDAGAPRTHEEPAA